MARTFPFLIDSVDYPVGAGQAFELVEHAVDAAVAKDPTGPEAAT